MKVPVVGGKEEMNRGSSHPSVHPVEAPPLRAVDAAENPMPRGRMEEIQGMPGTPGGLALRLLQFAFALLGLSVMASTSDFPSVTAFWYSIILIHFILSTFLQYGSTG